MQPREHRVEFQLKLYLVFRRRLAVKARVYSRLGGWFQRERERPILTARGARWGWGRKRTSEFERTRRCRRYTYILYTMGYRDEGEERKYLRAPIRRDKGEKEEDRNRAGFSCNILYKYNFIYFFFKRISGSVQTSRMMSHIIIYSGPLFRRGLFHRLCARVQLYVMYTARTISAGCVCVPGDART